MNSAFKLRHLTSAIDETAGACSLLPFDTKTFQEETGNVFANDVLPAYREMFSRGDHDERLNMHLADLLDRHKKYLFVILRTAFPYSTQVMALAARLWVLSLAMDDLLDRHDSRLGVDSYWRSVGMNQAHLDIMDEVRKVYAETHRVPVVKDTSPEPYVDLAFQALDRQQRADRTVTLQQMLSLYVERQAFISIWPYAAQCAPHSIQVTSALLSVAGQIHNDLKDYSEGNLDGSHGLINVPVWFEQSWLERKPAVVSSALLGQMLLKKALEHAHGASSATDIVKAICWRAPPCQH